MSDFVILFSRITWLCKTIVKRKKSYILDWNALFITEYYFCCSHHEYVQTKLISDTPQRVKTNDVIELLWVYAWVFQFADCNYPQNTCLCVCALQDGVSWFIEVWWQEARWCYHSAMEMWKTPSLGCHLP